MFDLSIKFHAASKYLISEAMLRERLGTGDDHDFLVK